MKHLKLDELKDFEYNWNGLLVSEPKNPLQYDSAFYIYGKYINHNNDIEYHRIDLYKEDSDLFSTFKLVNYRDVIIHKDRFEWYQFEDLNDFCHWYFVDKENRTKKTEDLNKSVEIESLKNREHKKKVYYFEQKYGFNPYEEDAPEELCYWEIYNDDNCDNELKRIIEKKWPKIKELSQNKNHRTLKLCSDLKEAEGELKLYSVDEIRDKINPGWNTRREKLKDVLKLLELRDMRQNTMDSLMQSTDPSMQEYLVKQLERDEKRIEDFLNEKIN